MDSLRINTGIIGVMLGIYWDKGNIRAIWGYIVVILG